MFGSCADPSEYEVVTDMKADEADLTRLRRELVRSARKHGLHPKRRRGRSPGSAPQSVEGEAS
jgi:hypothetical protein